MSIISAVVFGVLLAGYLGFGIYFVCYKSRDFAIKNRAVTERD